MTSLLVNLIAVGEPVQVAAGYLLYVKVHHQTGSSNA